MISRFCLVLFVAGSSFAGRCPGICQDDSVACASGAYKSDLCPGPNNIRCCAAAAPKCASKTQQCQANSIECGGVYLSGFCPGPNDIQCCSLGGSDDDIFHGDIPLELEQAYAFVGFGAWSSFVSASCMLTSHLWCMPESRQKMRPRMLLVLLSLDAAAGLFTGLRNLPAIALSSKFHDQRNSASLDDILFVLG